MFPPTDWDVGGCICVTQTVHAYALTEKLGCWLKGGYMFALLHMSHIKEQITYASLDAKEITVGKVLKLISRTHKIM